MRIIGGISASRRRKVFLQKLSQPLPYRGQEINAFRLLRRFPLSCQMTSGLKR